jgi:3',5'-nucleoside bisphosphate phosphatase
MQNGMSIAADLHTHSTASDGELNPSQLISLAASKGLKAISLTDHDTLKGLPLAMEAGEKQAVRVIPGVEIGAAFEPGMLHILGYFPTHPEGLEDALERMQQARRDRIHGIIRKLNDLGIMLTKEDVLETAGDSQIGRPHIAKALLKKGFVRFFDEAFEKYLSKGKKAYVPKEKISWEEAVRIIRHYNGLPVLAHPYTLGLSEAGLEELTREMKQQGLAGIEVYYPEHTPEHTSSYERIAHSAGLILTGGSDFHGPLRNDIPVGDFGVDDTLMEIFLKRLMA